MPFSGFSKEILDYTRACEHLIGESIKRSNQFNHFSEEELRLVNYYAEEVARLLKNSMSRKGPRPF
jgi:hypothetical protein